jgi:hypothetical protein
LEVGKLRKKINITYAELNNSDELVLSVEEGISVAELKPMEQMLVDSDHISFIYVVEKNEEYTYIAIPDSVWPELKKALEKNYSVYISDHTDRLLLPGFFEELSYLIENIRGNSNYGDKMVEKVENIF